VSAPLTSYLTLTNEDWMNNPLRKCRGEDTDRWFPTEVDPRTGEESEPAYAPPDVQRACGTCEVRAHCLQYALDTDQGSGVWGGLTTYQRDLIKKPKQRKHCPSCDSVDVIQERHHELCLACGVSWAVW